MLKILKICLVCASFLILPSATDNVQAKEYFDHFNQPARLTSLKILSHDGKEELLKFRELAKKIVSLGPNEDQEKVAILNEYVDDLLSNLNSFIVQSNLDPIPLEGFEAGFQWFIFSGWIKLFDGWVRGLGTITRTGDVIIRYEYPNVKIYMPLGFDSLRFDYQYEIKFMHLGPDGGAEGKAEKNKFTVELDINMSNLRMNLDRFALNTLGSVSFKFNGSIITDWIINLVIGVIIPIFKPILRLVIQGFVVDGLSAIMATYNGAICALLDDCAEQLMNVAYLN